MLTQEINIKMNGNTKADLELALEEVMRLIQEGNIHGYDLDKMSEGELSTLHSEMLKTLNTVIQEKE